MDEAESLPDWNSLYASFKKYSHCDDGAIWEGYSETVSRLFADKWLSMGGLRRLTSRDAAFRAFVLKHVDELWTLERATRVRALASAQCPRPARGLCRDLLLQLDDAQSPAASSRDRPTRR